MKRLLLLVCLACCMMPYQMHAQVVTWSVRPGFYDKIEPCWETLFLVSRDGVVGVVNQEGQEIVPLQSTRITGFYSGLALVLKSEGGQERILGILSTDGQYTSVNGRYYTIPGQELFSEGMLTVMTAQGNSGYMNAKGQMAHEFNGDELIYPFSEGYAAVGEGQDFQLLNKRFNPIDIQLPSVAAINGGASVYQDVALIWDTKGKCYNFNVRQGTCTKTRTPQSEDPDYLGGFACITGRPTDIPYEEIQLLAPTLEPTRQNGKYGYIKNGKTILPCQLEQAEPFRGSSAIVKTRDGYGLMRLYNGGDSFSAVANNPNISYKRSGRTGLEHRFSVTMPDQWVGTDVTVQVTDATNGARQDVSANGGTYLFKADGQTGTREFNIEVNSQDLHLWNGSIAYNYKVIPEDTIGPNIKPFTVTLQLKNQHADRNNRCWVVATVTNPNPAAITATVTFKGSNLLEAVSKRVTVSAHGSEDVSTCFTVKTRAAKGQLVTVTTTAGGKATLDGLQLIPF